ncbi:unnamed protein product [Zymoseptoria tritici ST99CH_1A5]|uniref:FAD-binding domain-containing protein n=1 Tax=Zymoseptoria tritici ST99CH_1A5 TaxID=1276529 RepID=A0A1Y6LEI1_ZYMTR|nr:unnamed protein product [Zymoseptoria tritici ST99CH_1A5]
MSSNKKDFEIAIIGGGISGLTLAIALHSRGIPITVYEQAPHFAEIGAGVSFTDNAGQAMKICHAGIYEAFERVRTSNMWPEKAKVWFDYHDGYHDKPDTHVFTISNKIGQAGVHRAHYLDELVKLLPTERAQFGKRLEKLDKTSNERWKLNFADGSSAEADAVIGCDGIKSKVRQLMYGKDHPCAYPTYTHKYAYRALATMEDAVKAVGGEKAQNACMHMGPGGHVLTFPVNHGKTLNVVAFHTTKKDWPDHERLTVPGKREEAMKDFEGFGPNVTKLLQLCEPNLDIWGIFHLGDNPVPNFAKGTVCLVGDAAHATSPHHGAGSGLCIEDSAVIASLLADESVQSASDIGAIFATFDEVRRERGHWLVQSSYRMGNCYEWLTDGVGEDFGKIEEEINRRNAVIADVNVQGMCDEARGVLRKKLGSEAVNEVSPIAVLWKEADEVTILQLNTLRIWRGEYFVDIVSELHKAYGPVVRTGPNRVSFASAEAIPEIYGTSKVYSKAASYQPMTLLAKGQEIPTIVTLRDEKRVTEIKRHVSNGFAQSTWLKQEHQIDGTIDILLDQLRKRAGTVISLNKWLSFWGFDTLTMLAFSDMQGHMEAGAEVDKTSAGAKARFDHWRAWALLPSLEALLYKNRFVQSFQKPSSGLAKLAMKRIEERKASTDEDAPDQDLLGRYLAASKKAPDMIGSRDVMALTISTIHAGSETVAHTSSFALAYALDKMEIFQKLEQEILTAGIRSSPAAYADVEKLPYLDAIIREALRFSASPNTMERTIPPAGAEICGVALPGGTDVSVAKPCTSRDESIFGPHADQFDPERWLHADEQQRREMEHATLAFSFGRRVCIGQHLARIEMKKLIATVVREFKIQPVNVGIGDWDGNFKKLDLDVKLTPRVR